MWKKSPTTADISISVGRCGSPVKARQAKALVCKYWTENWVAGGFGGETKGGEGGDVSVIRGRPLSVTNLPCWNFLSRTLKSLHYFIWSDLAPSPTSTSRWVVQTASGVASPADLFCPLLLLLARVITCAAAVALEGYKPLREEENNSQCGGKYSPEKLRRRWMSYATSHRGGAVLILEHLQP